TGFFRLFFLVIWSQKTWGHTKGPHSFTVGAPVDRSAGSGDDPDPVRSEETGESAAGAGESDCSVALHRAGVDRQGPEGQQVAPSLHIPPGVLGFGGALISDQSAQNGYPRSLDPALLALCLCDLGLRGLRRTGSGYRNDQKSFHHAQHDDPNLFRGKHEPFFLLFSETFPPKIIGPHD